MHFRTSSGPGRACAHGQHASCVACGRGHEPTSCDDTANRNACDASSAPPCLHAGDASDASGDASDAWDDVGRFQLQSRSQTRCDGSCIASWRVHVCDMNARQTSSLAPASALCRVPSPSQILLGLHVQIQRACDERDVRLDFLAFGRACAGGICGIDASSAPCPPCPICLHAGPSCLHAGDASGAWDDDQSVGRRFQLQSRSLQR